MAVDSLEANPNLRTDYDHARYEKRRRFLRFLIKWLGIPLLAKVDHAEGMENIPKTGPGILMINHIAYVDPIIVLHYLPRDIVPLAKIEVYNYPVINIFPRMWGVIPVSRDKIDRRAIQKVLHVLRAGEIVLVAPEGTRGPQLRSGKGGIAYLASRSGAPIIPVAVEGTEGFPALRFTAPWRGSGALIRFGQPFRYRPEFSRAGRDQLRKMTDEAMYVLAGMLPTERRGKYKDLTLATKETIEEV